MNTATEIKNLITMDDIAIKYGFKPNRSGFINCPFHNENTPSLKMYKGNKGFSCFGCGESGDIIQFVMKYFEINFMQALVKIDTDFHLGLTGKRLSDNEKKMIVKEQVKKSQIALFEQKQEERINELYNFYCANNRRMLKNKNKYAPKKNDKCIHPLYLEATGAEYKYNNYLCEILFEIIKEEIWKNKKRITS